MSLNRIIKHHLLDLAVCIAFPISLYLKWIPPYYSLLFYPGDSILLLAIPFWIIVRMSFHIFKLSDLPTRQNIALTIMPAKKYLITKLRLPIVMVLLSAVSGYICVGIFTNGVVGFPTLIELILFIIACLVTIIASFSGLFHLLLKLCRGSSTFSLFIPFLYYLTLPLSVFAFMTMYMKFGLNLTKNADAILLSFIIVTCIIYVSLIIRNWRRACAAYYKFE